jgi:hypothetical protein
MYLQKHNSHRPAELIRAHLERLDRDRAAADEERRTLEAAAAAGLAEGPLRHPQEGPEAMEEDGAALGGGVGVQENIQHSGEEEFCAEQQAVTELGPDGSPMRRSRRSKVGRGPHPYRCVCPAKA